MNMSSMITPNQIINHSKTVCDGRGWVETGSTGNGPSQDCAACRGTGIDNISLSATEVTP